MDRRSALKSIGALSAFAGHNLSGHAQSASAYDVMVVGAGLFGVWTAYNLQQLGKSVALVDAVSPAHSSASSGGESRVIRCGYGDADLYTDWAYRSLAEWQALSDRLALPIFHKTGVLWLHQAQDTHVNNSIKVLKKRNIPYQQFNARELSQRYPGMRVNPDEYGFFEPQAGSLMARRAIQTLAREIQSHGVDFINAKIKPISASHANNGALPDIQTNSGKRLKAEQYVFACGPWLNKICPEVMGDKLFVTRQEVAYFAGDNSERFFPAWADLPFYGIPYLEGRGFKVANDTHGKSIDPDTEPRTLSKQGETEIREFLAKRFPSIAESRLLEHRVCQYENSSNGDFIIDRYPGLDNVLIAGGGSGHAFKHGPAIGAHIAALLLGKQKPIKRFSLASKESSQRREVQ